MKRRNFLKQLGLAAALPTLGRVALAAPETYAKSSATAHTVLSCNIRVALPEDETGHDEDRRHGNSRHCREPVLCSDGGSLRLLFGAGKFLVGAQSILAAKHANQHPAGAAHYRDLADTGFCHALQG